jgi:hypothetical protein
MRWTAQMGALVLATAQEPPSLGEVPAEGFPHPLYRKLPAVISLYGTVQKETADAGG